MGTNWRTEILAGVTTFMTMAYIVFVNPSILHEAGMPLAAVTAATCLSAAFGSILMGLVARYPLALAPGMGLNAVRLPGTGRVSSAMVPAESWNRADFAYSAPRGVK